MSRGAREGGEGRKSAGTGGKFNLARPRALLAGPSPGRGWGPLHLRASPLFVPPPRAGVVWGWHARLAAWLLGGGHAAPGEVDPFVTALREGAEETGLEDLRPWPGPEPTLVHLIAVPVPAGKGEPAHEHLDVRYVLATDTPAAARPENPSARLQWLTVTEALAFVAEDNLRVALGRVADLLVDA